MSAHDDAPCLALLRQVARARRAVREDESEFGRPELGRALSALCVRLRAEFGGAVGDLAAALRDDDPLVRAEAAVALVDAATADARTAVSCAAADPDARVRLALALALERRAAFAPGLVCALLDDDDADTRHHAMDAAARLAPAEALQALAPTLRHADPATRERLAMALRVVGDDGPDGARDRLLLALAGEASGRIRLWAIEALGSSRGAAAFERVLVAMTDEDARVRRAAVDSLGVRGDARALPVLLATLARDTTWVTARVPDALAMLITPSTRDAVVTSLLAALAHPDASVRDATTSVLEVLVRRDGVLHADHPLRRVEGVLRGADGATRRVADALRRAGGRRGGG